MRLVTDNPQTNKLTNGYTIKETALGGEQNAMG